MSSAPPLVLTFAASDPTGGAGVQADLLTLAARGCHPLSVVTALTVQDTSGVRSLHPVDASCVQAQAELLLAEMRIAAFKLGVLGSAANVETIARLLETSVGVPVVLDPVLASGRGDPLATHGIIAELRSQLLPRSLVCTPNRGEAERLGGVPAILGAGCRYVLVTGADDASGDDVVNTLYDASGVVREDRWPRLPGRYHGSGCTLASALAAALAHGRKVTDAVQEAQQYTWHALSAGFAAGRGQAIPQRFLQGEMSARQ